MARRLGQRGVDRLVARVFPPQAPPPPERRENVERSVLSVIGAINSTERAFVDRAVRKRKCNVWRSGWPDFLVESPDGSWIAVEVKVGDDNIRTNQTAMFAALERAGVPVYVWNPRAPEKLAPWRYYETDKQLTRRLASAPVKVAS